MLNLEDRSKQKATSISQVTQSQRNVVRHNRPVVTRRSFLKCGVAASAAPAVPWTVRQAFASRSARSLLTKYIQPLPLPGAGIVVATPSGMNEYAFTLREIARQLHPNLPPTPFWAYDDGSGLGGQAGSFGMAVVAQSGTALDVSYTSNLPEFYPDWIPVVFAGLAGAYILRDEYDTGLEPNTDLRLPLPHRRT